MWLTKKSRKVVAVSTSMKDERVSLPKPKSQLAQLHDDDEDVFATSVTGQICCQTTCFARYMFSYICCYV